MIRFHKRHNIEIQKIEKENEEKARKFEEHYQKTKKYIEEQHKKHFPEE